jgi:GT2 family glycosyltransferase
MTTIAIIVLNWQQPQLTLDTISSILGINHPDFDYHLFLVDNFSQDNSWDIFQNKFQNHPQITLIRTPENLGYAGGNNYGIKAAIDRNFEYCLIINNDVLVDPNFLSYLLKSFTHQPHLGLSGPKIYFAPGYEFHQQRYKPSERGRVIWFAGGKFDWNNILGTHLGVDEIDQGQFDQPPAIDFLTGCCFLVKTEVFRQIGLFDPDYFMYLEDLDFCHRAQLAGYKLAFAPKSIIWHLNAGSSKSGSSLHDYYITRNRLLFGFKYATLKTKFALFRESIRFLFHSTTRRRAVLDFYTHRLGRNPHP